MSSQSLYHSFQRYRTLKTHRISALPIVILMPHSACNCRCIMCDIWKGNKNLKQLKEEDINNLLGTLRKWGTRQVVMSGGEALLNPNFFRLCMLLKQLPVHITLLSTGLSLKKHAAEITDWVDELIVSLDGDPAMHDAIRNIEGAFAKMQEGIREIRSLNPLFRISSRTVIHRLNFRRWGAIIHCAKVIGVDQVSFLPADVSSHAFNRQAAWDIPRQSEIAISKTELAELRMVMDELFIDHAEDFASGFIAESRAKIDKIYSYYSALHGLGDFPYKECNAPWVSTVIEPDGNVKPCFFHDSIGNIKNDSLEEILNGPEGLMFRKELDMDTNETCRRCVCSLNLQATRNPVNAVNS